jgi:hypothetical protein
MSGMRRLLHLPLPRRWRGKTPNGLRRKPLSRRERGDERKRGGVRESVYNVAYTTAAIAQSDASE